MGLRDFIASRLKRRETTLAANALGESVLPLPNHDVAVLEPFPAHVVPRPRHLGIALQLHYQEAGQALEKAARHAVIVHSPIYTIGAGGYLHLYGFTGFCAATQSKRTFHCDRIVEVRDALTGQIVDDLHSHLRGAG